MREYLPNHEQRLGPLFGFTDSAWVPEDCHPSDGRTQAPAPQIALCVMCLGVVG